MNYQSVKQTNQPFEQVWSLQGGGRPRQYLLHLLSSAELYWWKGEMAVRAGEDTGTEEGLQAGKEKKARPAQVSVPTCQTNRFSVRK